MKKFLALVMAMMMVLAMGTAFADGDTTTPTEVTYEASAATSFTVNKTYTSDETFVPAETLEFEVAPAKDAEGNNANPDTEMITVAPVAVDTDAADTTLITVQIPSYDTVGVYNYTIKEKEGSTAGVTYDKDKTIYVVVMVEYDNVNHKLVIGNVNAYIKKIDGTKTDVFANIFDTADFTVAKDVSGNMANENDDFEIKVTLTSTKDVLSPITVGGTTVPAMAWVDGVYETTLTMSEFDGATTFANIPVGVTVKVEEIDAGDYTKLGYRIDNATETVDGVMKEKLVEAVNFTTDAEKANTDVVVRNEKTTSVETAVTLDNAPYMMIMGMVVLAGVAMMMKRRAY